MRALTATGVPAATVEFTDVPEPVAGPSEAVVEVEAFSVNRGDMFALTCACTAYLPNADRYRARTWLTGAQRVAVPPTSSLYSLSRSTRSTVPRCPSRASPRCDCCSKGVMVPSARHSP
jgi:hypothetical protein